MQDLRAHARPRALSQLDVTQSVQARQVQAVELEVALALVLNLDINHI